MKKKKTLTLPLGRLFGLSGGQACRPNPASGRGRETPARPFSRLREKVGMRVFFL
jgi:hypothetical protein